MFNYNWDGNGNLLSDGVATYTYNAADQMSSMTKGSDIYTYAYNGMGDRYEQTINGVSTTYQLDLAANLTQVLNDGDNSYLYGLDRIAQVSTTQTGYFLPDALGSVRQVVDPQAQIQLSRSYTPFGEELASSGSYETPFGFAGEMQDASGLLYLRARYPIHCVQGCSADATRPFYFNTVTCAGWAFHQRRSPRQARGGALLRVYELPGFDESVSVCI